MNWVVTTALRLRHIVVAAAVLVMFLGVDNARRADFDVFPEFAPPVVEIQTEAPALSAEEVERLVTVPLEQALHGAPWLATIRSKSVLGLSSVSLIFEDGTDILRARQMVQERLAVEASRLPAVARAPIMLPPLSSVSRVMKIGLTSKELSQVQMSEIATWTIRPRLMALHGVANVAIWGQRDRQYQVLIDPARLQTNGVTLDEVTRATGDAVVVAGGGFIDLPNQRLALQHLSPIASAEDLGRSVVAFRGGAPIRLADVAEVRIDHSAPIGDAVVNDGPGLLLIVEKQLWGNTLAVTHEVDAAIEAMKPALVGIDVDATIFRPATFIERSLDNLQEALLLGCVLVVGVLILFFWEWRAAMISMVTIPLSLLAAVSVLLALGGTVNTMMLAGLVIAVGVVVDDAVIDVENVVRRLRVSPGSAGAFNVVRAASIEVRSAVVLASLIVVLVFMPVFFLPGLAGSFFRPLATAYVLAVLASMIVALTATPALSLMLLPAARRTRSPLASALDVRYRRLLPAMVSRPRLAVVLVAAASLVTIVAVVSFGEEFIPSFKETDFLMHWVGKPGTSLEAMRRITERVSAELRAIPGVRNFGAHIGRAEAADEVVGPNFAELWVSIEPTVDYDATVRRIQAVVDGYPGLYRDVLTYLKERTKEVLTGAGAAIVVRIFGTDLDVLRSKAQEAAAAMASVDGVTNLKVEPSMTVPRVTIRMRPAAADAFGLTAGGLRRAVSTLVQGTTVGEVFEGERAYAVVVWGTPGVRDDPLRLGDVLVDTPDGGQVPLGDVAEITIEPTPNEIKRDGGSRRIDVTCNVAGRDLGSVARDVERALGGVSFPREYHSELLGEFSAREESQRRLLVLGAMALLGIVLLLHVEFGSWRLTWLVCATMPFATFGGVLGAWFGGGVLSLGSLVGFVTLLGIAARNAIMLLSHYQHLETVEGEPFGPRLIVRGAAERLAPILMTALCAGLGLLPLVLRGNAPGHEIEYPMAVVILGGLATSTVLNVLLMPSLYARFGRPGEPALISASDLSKIRIAARRLHHGVMATLLRRVPE